MPASVLTKSSFILLGVLTRELARLGNINNNHSKGKSKSSNTKEKACGEHRFLYTATYKKILLQTEAVNVNFCRLPAKDR